MRQPLLKLLVTVAALLPVAWEPARADDRDTCGESTGALTSSGGSVAVSHCDAAPAVRPSATPWPSAQRTEHPVAPPPSTLTCTHHESDGLGDPTPALGPEALTPGAIVFLWCIDTETHETVVSEYVTIGAGAGAVTPQVDPQVLAQHARAQLVLPLPEPRAWPGIDRPQTTGVSTWLHVDNFAGASQSASAGPVTATVHAEPVEVVWVMGDGNTVTCHDAGGVWGADPETSCQHLFIHRSTGQGDGRFHGSVSIRWRLRWESSTGDGGSLGDVTRTTPIDWLVQEIQATIR
jgi:hypothetical protein